MHSVPKGMTVRGLISHLFVLHVHAFVYPVVLPLCVHVCSVGTNLFEDYVNQYLPVVVSE